MNQFHPGQNLQRVAWANQSFKENSWFFRIVRRIDQVDWNDRTVGPKQIAGDALFPQGIVNDYQLNVKFFKFG